jgi:hypothetical protein
MSHAIHISPSIFAHVFRRFQRQVEHAEHSPGPFRDFQSGLAYSMEQYKEWLYLEARRRLHVASWKESWVGTGKIVSLVVKAIEINEDENHRNNIVAWQGRRGPTSKSTLKLLAARDDGRQWSKTEKILWDMYFEEEDPKKCFEDLVKLFGGRYDLISYLFFLRDWDEFVPLKSTFFPDAFELLGVPHSMRNKCNWENYMGVVARLREVQRHLQGYGIPGGVRLIDAHSFCWMLIDLPEPPEEKRVLTAILSMTPTPGAPPQRDESGGKGMTQQELDETKRNQKRIGDLAQAVVLAAERKRLKDNGLAALANRVKDVSDDVSLGYDIASFTSEGESKPIEVKAAAKRGNDLRFFLSENERIKASTLPNYHFVLVLDVESNKPVLREFVGNALPSESLHPIQYEVRLRQ